MGRRRGNQEGSIYPREDGRWRAQITLDGRRLSFSAKTRRECQEWLKQIKKQIEAGLSYTGAHMRLDQYLGLWLTTVRENRRDKTFIQYRGLVKNYILPEFGSTRLRDLQPIRIEKYLNSKKEAGVGDRTCQLIYSTLHTALAAAVKKGLIGRNPMAAVDKPRVRNPKKKVVLSPEEIQRLMIQANQHRNAVLYHLALVTGMRQGELLALQWSDIDWQKSRLQIERQAQRVPRKGMVISPTKTEAGKRIVALGSITMARLEEQRKRILEEKEKAKDGWQEHDLVFPTPIGTLQDPHNLLKEFKELLSHAGLPPMRFHDLRHTSVTLVLNEVGAPIKEAQTRVGHASPSTTINIYGGPPTSKLDEIVAQSMDELITPVAIELHRNRTENDELQE